MLVSAKVTGLANARRVANALAMTPIERKRTLQKMARVVIKKTRQRLRGQQGLDGQAWTPRKKRGARKMLRRVGRTLRIRTNNFTATVGATNPVANRVSAAQQYGVDEVMTSTRMAKIHDKSSGKPATKRQAKTLQKMGYKVKQAGTEKGKGWRKASQTWIKKNMTRWRAGRIIRFLRGTEGKQAWKISLPSRTFLGATEQEIYEMNEIINQSAKV